MNDFSSILRTLQKPAQFFFVRHGESEGNLRGQMQGHDNQPLTETGRDQARNTAAWFGSQGVRIDRVYASPLARAFETARILADSNGYHPPEPMESLKELYMGSFSGLTIPQIKERFPNEYRLFTVGSWEAVPGAEPVTSLAARALTAWEQLVRDANAGVSKIVSVTHGGMIQWILKTSFGTTPESGTPWMPLIKASNCSVFLFSARPAGSDWYYGQWSLMNYVPGREPELGEQFHTNAR